MTLRKRHLQSKTKCTLLFFSDLEKPLDPSGDDFVQLLLFIRITDCRPFSEMPAQQKSCYTGRQVVGRGLPSK